MRKIYLTILFILFTVNLFSQDTLTIMSYNVENLFDT
ncbi:MAG: endonuclease, partial [Bacteroidetes bacterium]